MFDFQDKVAIVTGAAGNLGRAVTRVFFDAGARVAVVDRQREMTAEVFAGEIPEGEYCRYVGANLMDEGSVANAIEAIVDQFGRIDILVNIAGGFRSGPPIHETSVDTWDFMLDLNARTAFLTSRAVIPHMLRRNYGRIISVAARAALEGKANMGPYVISKMAVIRLTETMAAELKHEGITVNCILPGTIDTPANRRDMPNANFDRWVPPESLANVIAFLASDLARDVNGAALPVYGRS